MNYTKIITYALFIGAIGILFSYNIIVSNISTLGSPNLSQSNDTNFVGVNVQGYYTTTVENRIRHTPMPHNYYEDSFRVLSLSRINFVRFLFTWESYEKNPGLFMQELATVANLADKYGLNVIYANDQYHISSWLDAQLGYGFPSLLFKDHEDKFPRGGGGGANNITSRAWWTSWYDRLITDRNGNDGWMLQGNFLNQVVKAVDNHASTIGYEIINEPQVYATDQWDKIGNYNTYIAKQLRTFTAKLIAFDRQLPSDIDGQIDAFPENMAKMAPHNIKNTLFKSSLYDLPTHCSYAEERLTIVKRTAEIAGVPLWIGEFNMGTTPQRPIADINQTGISIFLQKFKELGTWGSFFWWWSFEHNPKYVRNFDLANFTKHHSTIQTTKYFEYLKNAISASNHGLLAHNTNQSGSDTICPTISITHINDTKLGRGNQSGLSQFTRIALNAKSTPLSFLIKGKGYDIGSGLRIIEIKTDNNQYKAVTPKVQNDWSDWSALLQILTKGYHKIVVRGTDNEGNTNYDTRFINVQ